MESGTNFGTKFSAVTVVDLPRVTVPSEIARPVQQPVPLNPHRIRCVASLALLCGFIVCGCGAGANYAPTMSKNSREAKMREAEKFDLYRLYYAGEKVNGLPLTGISDARAGR